jgi:hypothetical protein
MRVNGLHASRPNSFRTKRRTRTALGPGSPFPPSQPRDLPSDSRCLRADVVWARSTQCSLTRSREADLRGSREADPRGDV